MVFRNCSFLIDFKLILLTAFVVLFPKIKLNSNLFKNLPEASES